MLPNIGGECFKYKKIVIISSIIIIIIIIIITTTTTTTTTTGRCSTLFSGSFYPTTGLTTQQKLNITALITLMKGTDRPSWFAV
jgi:hypothetical protein